MINKFIKTHDVGYLLGEISDNTLHKHYAVQIVISLRENIILHTNKTYKTSKSQIIKSMEPHRLDCLGQHVLILLINPVSKLGHLLNKHSDAKTVKLSQKQWIENLRDLAINWYNNSITNLEFKKAIEKVSEEFTNENNKCFHESDKRILSALELLRENVENITSLERIASQVFLSPSRFIHLFKIETGITYRRMQLWNKLMASIDDISKHKSITDLAYAHGFSDSAHYSRTFKQTFGINPKDFFKFSQFIQF